jgi:hypothetical protein
MIVGLVAEIFFLIMLVGWPLIGGMVTGIDCCIRPKEYFKNE